MKTKIILITILQLLLFVSFTGAAEPADFSDRFHEPYDTWMNGEMDFDELFQEMNVFESIIEDSSQGWEQKYWLAKVALVRGMIYYEKENEDASIDELEKSHDLAQESIDIKANSDSYRIMAEGSSLIMLQKGLAYIILNFKKGQKQAKEALELDPDNARASLVIAQFLCNAPGIAGGSKKKGIALLETIKAQSNLINEDRFHILMTLSDVLMQKKRYPEAINVCLDALNIFPGNETAQDLYRELLSK